MIADFSGLSVAHSDANGAIINGGCLEVLDVLATRHPEGLASTIFADPPYFLSNGGITCQNGRRVKVDKGGWDKSQGPDENHKFNLAWLAACQRLLKPDGTIWISGTHHVIHSVGFALQSLGFRILNGITWEKPNPPPNLACRTFISRPAT
jgi:site-specific DNA-methyltransferase (adenine-specific)